MEQLISEEDPLDNEDGDNGENLKCEPSGGNVEESSNFLGDFVGSFIPCLICGGDLQVDGVIKEEIDDEEGGGGVGRVSDEEIFQWFLKWFKLNSKKKKKKLTSVKGYHCSYSGKLLRFCAHCKMELIGILGIQREVDQLEKEIIKGLDKVKGRMEGCEGNFIISGVYERDFSFRRIRSLIIKCGGVGEKTTKQLNCGNSQVSSGHPKISRKSTRKKMPVTRFEAMATSQEPYLLPVVMVSSSDKAKADVHLDIDIKSEPDVHLTNLSEEDPMIPPPSPPPSSSQVFNKPIKKKSFSKRKATKSKKSPKSARSSPKKKPEPSFLEDYQDQDDWEDNYFLDDLNDDDDKPLNTEEQGKPKRKRRKKGDSDEDFILDEDDEDPPPEKDDDMDFQWNGKYELISYKLRYKIDPSDPSKIYLGTSNTFIITSNPPQGHQEVQCSTCSTILKHDKETLRRHIIRYHTYRFACTKCDYRGASKNELSCHIQANHEISPRTFPRIPCKICGKPIPNRKQGIKNHERTHMSSLEKDEVISSKNRVQDIPKRYQCDECGKSFDAPSYLRKHKQNNHQDDFEKPKELCPECGGTFKNLQSHIRYMHGGGGGGEGVDGPRIWECTEENCGTKFKRLNVLIKHKNAVHKKIRPFKCTLCPREFSGKKSLQNHTNGHLGIRPWRCEVGGCGVGFLTKAGLKRHNRIYHEEGSRPKRKAFVRGPTVLGADFRKGDLQRKGTYYPPSALKGWAKGRVPGHLMEGEGQGDGGEGEQINFTEDNQNSN